MPRFTGVVSPSAVVSPPIIVQDIVSEVITETSPKWPW